MNAEPESPRSLADALSSFTMREVLGYDFVLGLLGAAGGAWVGVAAPKTLARVVPVAAALVGIVIGAVVAGVAVLAAFLDQSFLRKLRRIEREPVRYVAPFLFTAVLGIVASLLLLVLAALPVSSPTWLVGVVSGLGGLAVVWTLASVIRNLSVLVQFIGLRFEASDLPDES